MATIIDRTEGVVNTEISDLDDLPDLPGATEGSQTQSKPQPRAIPRDDTEDKEKRPVGRPRKDGLPPKTAPNYIPPTPTPTAKKYYTESPHDNRKPMQFLLWWKALPLWAQERLTVYVYRMWPVMKPAEKDEAGNRIPGADYIYIDKLGEPLLSLDEFQDRYGAGDYKLLVNDDVVEKRTICEVYIREGYRDLRAHPPTDRRIDDVNNVELSDPANRSYVQYLRGKGKLPEQKEKDVLTAETSRDALVSKLIDKVTERPRDNSGSNMDKSFDVLASAAIKGQEIIQSAVDRAEQSRAAAPDPMDTLNKAASILEKFRKNDTPPPVQGDASIVSTFMTGMMEMNKTIQEIQSQRIAFAEKVALEARSGVAAGNPGEGKTGGGFKESLSEFLSMAEVLGLKRGGSHAIAAEPQVGWADRLPDIMESGAKILGTVMQGWAAIQHQQAVRDAQRQAQMMGMPVPMPQGPPQPPQQPQQGPQAQHQALAGVGGGPVNGMVGGDPAQDHSEAADFVAFMESIKEALLNHIDQDLGGAQFAEWLIDSRRDGKAIYKQIAGQGPMVLLATLKGYPPIGQELIGKDLVVNQFVEDFCKMEEIRAREMEAEGLEPEGA